MSRKNSRKGAPLFCLLKKGGEGAEKAFGAFVYRGGGHKAFAYQGGQEEQGEGGTQEEKGQESVLEHLCSGVFSSEKHICVVASRAYWSEIKSVLPELSFCVVLVGRGKSAQFGERFLPSVT